MVMAVAVRKSYVDGSQLHQGSAFPLNISFNFSLGQMRYWRSVLLFQCMEKACFGLASASPGDQEIRSTLDFPEQATTSEA